MAAPTLRSSSFTAMGSGTTISVTVPAGAAAGDVVLLFLRSNASITITPPAGFTQKYSGLSAPTLYTYVYWKRLTGADTGNYAFTISPSTSRCLVAACYSGVVGSGDPFDAGTFVTSVPSGGITTAVSITTTVADAMVVWAHQTNPTSTVTGPAGYTLVNQVLPQLAVYGKAQPSAGSTGNVTGGTTGAASSGVHLFALKPAVTIAKAHTFTDNFATQIDPAKWDTSGAKVAWDAGYASILEQASAINWLRSKAHYDLMGSYVYAQVWPPTPMTIQTAVGLEVYNDAGTDGLGMYITTNGTQPFLTMRHTQGGTNDDTLINYNSTAHAYVDVEITGGVARWYTSPDAVTWTEVRNRASTLDLSNVQIWLSCGQNGAGATQNIAWFDNINTAGSTAHPLSGTIAAISATSGNPAARYPLSGVTVATTATTGSPAAVHPLSGVITATTATTGTIVGVHPLSGTIVATTATTGNPAAVHPLVGTPTAAITATTGSIEKVTGAQAYPLSGVITVTTATSGTIVAVHPLSGVIVATTTTTGTIVGVHPLSGVIIATTATTGSPAAVHPLSGVVTVVSATTGSIEMVVGAQAYPLSGIVVVTSATTGTLQAKLALSGAVSAVVATIGNPTAVHPIAGLTAAVTTTTGTISQLSLALAGVTTAVTTTSGTPTAAHPLTGISSIVSTTSGTLRARLSLTGAVSGSTTAVGSIAARLALVGITAGITATTGSIGVSPRQPKAESFVDAFTTQIDTTKWDIYGTVVWEAGYVAATEIPNDYSALVSKNFYDLMNSYVYVQMEPPSPSTIYTETGLQALTADWNNGLSIIIRWDGTKNVVYFRHTQGGVSDDLVVDYNPTEHAYVSVQLWNGIAQWFTSPDRDNWALIRTRPSTLDLSLIQVWLLVGQNGVGATQNVGYFDSVNVPGSGPQALSGLITINSATSGNPKAKLALSGVTVSTSATTGNPAAAHPLSGVVTVTSTTTGSIAGARPLAGVVTVVSATTGSPVAIHPLSGVVTVISTTTGTINMVGGSQSYPLSGTIIVVTTTTGNPAAKYLLAGVVTSSSVVVGTIQAKYRLTGIVSVISTTTGTITIGIVVAGGRPKAYIASVWTKKPSKVWNNTAWVEKPMKKHTGSEWKALT